MLKDTERGTGVHGPFGPNPKMALSADYGE
jgi:hypothetical protein